MPRTCTVRVDAGDLYKGSFTVIQQGKVFFDLPEMPGAFSVSPAGETRDRYVSTNAYKWTARRAKAFRNSWGTTGSAMRRN